jgi:hypothetical protein
LFKSYCGVDTAGLSCNLLGKIRIETIANVTILDYGYKPHTCPLFPLSTALRQTLNIDICLACTMVSEHDFQSKSQKCDSKHNVNDYSDIPCFRYIRFLVVPTYMFIHIQTDIEDELPKAAESHQDYVVRD